jgi:AbiV family abortive infection protein
MTAKITPVELAQGAWYALEQCGHLLNDAVALFDLDRYATAVGLAMLAREEYGKARTLFKLAAEGQDVEPGDVALDDHIEKQTAARVSVMLRSSDPNSGVGKLLRQVSTYQSADPEWTEAMHALSRVVDAAVRRAPEERHRARMRSLYVDWEPTLCRWSRPEMSADEARHQLDHAINDYAVYERNINVAMASTVSPAVAALLNQWPQRPSLPLPRRPKPPW